MGALTNLSQDHLDFHPDMEDYFRTKAELFDGRARTEVVCVDGEWGPRLVKDGTITVATTGDAHWTASGVTVSATGEQAFTAHGPDGSALDVELSLPGDFNVANALLAIAALVAVGVDARTAADGVAACGGVPGRLELVSAGAPVRGVVDYAHKTDAIVAVLTALRELSGGRLICVLGAGGERDRGKRPAMGAAAAQGADVVIVTDDNPRAEDPAAIRAEVLAGAYRAATPARIIEVGGRRAAIDEAVRLAEPGDVVAVLGKGHERGQEVAGEVLPFDDRTELADALRARFGDLAGRP